MWDRLPATSTPSRILVMKVGVQNGEAWEAIVARKLDEERVAGIAYWGYGGAVCHPLTQVQPSAGEAGEPIVVLMIRTHSDFYGGPTWARAQSTDRQRWDRIPEGIRTSGRHALILRDLRPTDQVLDLGAYEVGIGPHSGTLLSQYLRGRVDKACARLAAVRSESTLALLAMRAELVAPYAVFLRTSGPT